VHRHDAADETFFVLDGELRVEVGGESYTAGAGAVASCPAGCRMPWS
jgi:quercetin dioxygenase-like cupin family protein